MTMSHSLLTEYFERIFQDPNLQRRLREDGADLGALVKLLQELQLDTTPQAFRLAAQAFARSRQLAKLEVNDLDLLHIVSRSGEPQGNDA
jgi:hypothetical protein